MSRKAKYYPSPLKIVLSQLSVYKWLERVFISEYDHVDLRKLATSLKETNPFILPGVLFPLHAIKKDIADTLKPYKSAYHLRRDFLQPVYGIGNLLRAFIEIVSLVFVSIFVVLASLYKVAIKHPAHLLQDKPKKSFLTPDKRSLSANFFDVFAKSANAIFSSSVFLFTIWANAIINIPLVALRGFAQILFTPATWFIKIPLRGIITACNGMPVIEENSGLQRKLASLKAALDVVNKDIDAQQEAQNKDNRQIFELSSQNKSLLGVLLTKCVDASTESGNEDNKKIDLSLLQDTSPTALTHKLIVETNNYKYRVVKLEEQVDEIKRKELKARQRGQATRIDEDMLELGNCYDAVTKALRQATMLHMDIYSAVSGKNDDLQRRNLQALRSKQTNNVADVLRTFSAFADCYKVKGDIENSPRLEYLARGRGFKR